MHQILGSWVTGLIGLLLGLNIIEKYKDTRFYCQCIRNSYFM